MFAIQSKVFRYVVCVVYCNRCLNSRSPAHCDVRASVQALNSKHDSSEAASSLASNRFDVRLWLESNQMDESGDGGGSGDSGSAAAAAGKKRPKSKAAKSKPDAKSKSKKSVAPAPPPVIASTAPTVLKAGPRNRLAPLQLAVKPQTTGLTLSDLRALCAPPVRAAAVAAAAIMSKPPPVKPPPPPPLPATAKRKKQKPASKAADDGDATETESSSNDARPLKRLRKTETKAAAPEPTATAAAAVPVTAQTASMLDDDRAAFTSVVSARPTASVVSTAPDDDLGDQTEYTDDLVGEEHEIESLIGIRYVVWNGDGNAIDPCVQYEVKWKHLTEPRYGCP